MSLLSLSVLVAQVAYGFGAGTSLTYDVNVKFDGFLPLFGGNEGIVDVAMTVGVNGQEPTDGALKATSEIQTFDLKFNEASLPVTLDNVTQFFPKTTVSLSPTGKILSNDAPDRKLPVRLPGLDVKRFPDITYIPIEFPGEETALGATWSFERDFGGAPLVYDCTLLSLNEETAEIAVKVRQDFTVFENAALEVVTDRAEAVSEVKTTLTGEGKVTFDTARGLATSSQMTNEAVSDVRNLASGTTSQRKLKTVYRVALKSASGAAKVTAVRPRGWQFNWETGRTFLAWIQMAVHFGLAALPREIERWAPGLKQVFPWLSQEKRPARR